MKVALISEHASPLAPLGGVDAGGQNIYVGNVARQLSARGHRVDVFTRRDAPGLPEAVDWAPRVRIVHVPAGPAAFLPKEEMLPHMPAFTRFMRDWLRRPGEACDLMHANFFMSGLVAADLKKETGIPFVMTFHALGRVRRRHQKEADGFPEARLSIEERLVREADLLLAECPQDKDDLVRHYGADPGRISIVPCGFDPEEFWPVPKAAARTALGLPASEPLWLHVGRLVPRKGVDTVIQAFARLRRARDVRSRLVIVGGDPGDTVRSPSPEMRRLMDLSREEGVQADVLFTGGRPRDQLRLYYSAADVFLTTPWYEPFGITPLEAMACGTPVIGSRVGGIQDSVGDGVTGFLVPPRDPDALARRMDVLQKAPSLRAALGRNALERVHRSFTWGYVAEGLISLYRKVLGLASSLMPAKESERRKVSEQRLIIDGLDRPDVRRVPRRLTDRLLAASHA